MTRVRSVGCPLRNAALAAVLALLACCTEPARDGTSAAKPAAAAPASRAEVEPFRGDFTGTVDGQPVGLTLRGLTNGEFRGVFRSGRGTATLIGRVEDGVLRGAMESGGERSAFVARAAKGGVHFSVVADGHLSQYTLARGPLVAPAAETTGEVAPPPVSPQVERDPRLCGRWTVSIVHGRLANTVTTYVNAWLSEDGRYQWGGSQSLITLRPAVGTPNTAGSASSDVEAGEWKTANSVIFYRYPGETAWRPWGRYGVSGGAVVVYPADGGDKQLWERP